MFLGNRARQMRRAINLTAICVPFVWAVCDLQHLTNLQAYTACYVDNFTLWRQSVLPVRYELDCKYRYK
jgi:hypothetical protein